jgi:hypothetical protein
MKEREKGTPPVLVKNSVRRKNGVGSERVCERLVKGALSLEKKLIAVAKRLRTSARAHRGRREYAGATPR